ncbi:Complement receptor type 2, partial [Mesitornis unicolor]
AQCQADKSWDPPVPVCERVKCLAPPSIANGEPSSRFSGTFDVGALVRYHCKRGFSLTGNESVRCMRYGVWSRPLPRCQVGCVSPGVGNGKAIRLLQRVKKKGHLNMTSLTESLYPFPKPGGVTGLQNQLLSLGEEMNQCCNGAVPSLLLHSLSAPSCQCCHFSLPDLAVVKCLHPPKITNGKLKGNVSDIFSYGASVSYSCNPGYSLVGNAFINCTASGTWSQPPPRCKEVRCVFPEVQGVKKAIKGNSYRSGTNITLECDDGYTLEGNSQIQCQEDLSWDPPVPACKLTSRKSGSVGLGLAAAGVLLLLGSGIVWIIISKQKEGSYNTYENYNYQTPLN